MRLNIYLVDLRENVKLRIERGRTTQVTNNLSTIFPDPRLMSIAIT